MVKGLSIVLPAYNEALNIPTAVGRALEVLPRLAESFEIIVIDDGSHDDTAAVARELVDKHYPRVRLLRHDENLGYGAPLRSGFQHSRHELVFYTDADNQFDIAELEYFLPMLAEYEMVVGFRVYRYDSVLRCMVSWIYNRIVRVLFRVQVRDVDCSYKLFRREVRDVDCSYKLFWREVLEKTTIDCENFFVDTELVARARKWNFRIAEKGVRHYPRMAGDTTVHASDVSRTLKEIARMWQRIYFPRRAQLGETEARVCATNVTEMVPEPTADAEELLL